MDGGPSGEHEGEAFEAALFRALARDFDGFLVCIDRERRILYLNRCMTGSPAAWLGKPIESLIAPADKQVAIASIEAAFAAQERRCYEFTTTLGDGGSLRTMTGRVIPFRGLNGQELALQLTRDITAQRRLEGEHQRSEEFRRLLIEHFPDFMGLVNRELRLVWVNRYAPGASRETVVGRPVTDFYLEGDRPTVAAAIEAAFNGQLAEYEFEANFEGRPVGCFLVRAIPLEPQDVATNVLLLSIDITERKRAELALRQTQELLHRAQRLESLGQLAGGIAHDFNNLLQVIGGNVAFAQQNLECGEPVTEELELALRATEQAAELTSQLLTIGRRKRLDSQRVEVGALVSNSMRMLRRAIPENIQLEYFPPPEPYFVDLDAPQFEQVLLNLCVNARDAMPGGGTLTVRVEPCGSELVLVSVSDTGVGIPAENLPRIFDPFFTTKGTGSGLGLAVAAGIVEAHGGSLVPESVPGRGTTMKIRLPRVPSAEEAPANPAKPRLVGTGTVLVAEDEELVRMQIARTLEHAGYTVLQAENGAVAVDLFRARRGQIDLVILDAVMPVLDGWHAFLELDKMQPGLAVLFTTGYAANVLPEDFRTRRAMRLLRKPYKANDLLAIVHELVSGRTRSARPA